MGGQKAQEAKGAGARNTCTACRRAKIRCDRASPTCGRCVRLGLPCIEQLRAQGRPSLPHADDAAAGRRKRRRSPMADDVFNFNFNTDDPAALAACRRQFIIPKAADALTRRVVSLCAARDVDISRAQAELRCWGKRSLRLGVDSSYGALGRISKALKMDAGALAEAEGGKPASEEPDGVMQRWGAGGLGLEEEMEEEQGRGEEAVMVACYVEDRGRVLFKCNEAFSERLMSAEECLAEVERCKCLPLYIWACILSPESSDELYESLALLLFAKARNNSNDHHDDHLIRSVVCIGRDKAPVPVLAQLQHHIQGQQATSVLSLTPLAALSPSFRPLELAPIAIPLASQALAFALRADPSEGSPASVCSYPDTEPCTDSASGSLCPMEVDEEEVEEEDDVEEEEDAAVEKAARCLYRTRSMAEFSSVLCGLSASEIGDNTGGVAPDEEGQGGFDMRDFNWEAPELRHVCEVTPQAPLWL